MSKKILVIICQLFILQTFGQNEVSFAPPLKIPMYLSGNFGEIRLDHFHSGIDIKTLGTIGQHVYSIERGYISRIKVQTNGYGKSIYITHPNGYTSVFAHLDGYREDIAQYVKQMQYKRRSQVVDLYLNPGQFQLMKGDFIAYSGNSGGSSGPHLHFEIRTSGTQHPTNVLKYDFDIVDHVTPKFLSLHIVPIGNKSHVNGSSEKFASTIVKDGGVYTIPNGSHITASGTLGISVEVYDYLNGVSNRCGVYTLEFYLNDELIYSHVMDEFSFAETQYVNAHMDYQEMVRSGIKSHRLYRLPNDKLNIYNNQISNKAIELGENRDYYLRVVASDVAGNKSELKFQITGKQMTLPERNLPAGFVKTMRYNELNRYVHDEVIVEIPAYALYQDLDFTFETSPGPLGSLTPFFQIASPEVPVHTPYGLSIKTSATDPHIQDKLLIVYLNDENEIESAGGAYRDGAIFANVRSFGKYALSLDTIAPQITPLNGAVSGNISGKKTLKFNIIDNLAGIEKYEGYIDNSWVLFEYDPKNDLLTYTFDSDRITNESNHVLELYVSDEKGNVSLFHTTFTW